LSLLESSADGFGCGCRGADGPGCCEQVVNGSGAGCVDRREYHLVKDWEKYLRHLGQRLISQATKDEASWQRVDQ
jgi:hypothetical protein